MAHTIEISNMQQLDHLLMHAPSMERKVQNIIRTIIREARGNVAKGAAADIRSSKAAEAAVKSSVYRRVLGGNINIIKSRRAGGQRAPLPPVVHKLDRGVNSKGNHRGGNRMRRTRRTEDLLTYYGRDRGFILRYLNDGTPSRDKNNTRYVGQIGARNWFGRRSLAELERASEKIAARIDELILQEFNEA